ncbi:hypothetical protein [Alicyclobacillus sp. ALC3]|uniref:hypothetical protein n=1 Tax=Alicyclobacillus sp. ALC3 TaxID=2796143 RepID=UPI0023798EB4|nr:hypothetical protein [Alicyclobacillus sp. ALC3]WDL98637.1 hypothetical protein JC200_08210 [Alicyclobacillus sp. ALC3]
MRVSSCCEAPIVVEVRSDLPNCTDDEYDLQVPFHVCSKCGAVIIDYLYPQGGEDGNAAAKGTRLHTANGRYH